MIRRILAASVLIFSSSAHAELIDRGGGLIYDDVLDVTWLQDANYAKTSGYHPDGKLSYISAKEWVSNLVYYDNVRGVAYDDWRLPTKLENDLPFHFGWWVANEYIDPNPTVGPHTELSLMYYEGLGLNGYLNTYGAWGYDFGVRGNSTFGGQNDVGLVKNLQGAEYWLDFNMADVSSHYDTQPFVLNFNNGNHYVRSSSLLPVWPVRDGDVPAVLSCDGFSPPADRAISVKKPNRVLPLRMTLRDSDGMSAWDLAAPVVNVNFAPANGDPSSDLEELTFAGRGDEGNQFLFDGTHWAFNLKTTGFAPGVYTITAKPGSADYVINPPCEVTLTVQ